MCVSKFILIAEWLRWKIGVCSSVADVFEHHFQLFLVLLFNWHFVEFTHLSYLLDWNAFKLQCLSVLSWRLSFAFHAWWLYSQIKVNWSVSSMCRRRRWRIIALSTFVLEAAWHRIVYTSISSYLSRVISVFVMMVVMFCVLIWLLSQKLGLLVQEQVVKVLGSFCKQT